MTALDGHTHRKGAAAAIVIVVAAATRVVAAIAIMVVLAGAVIIIAAAATHVIIMVAVVITALLACAAIVVAAASALVVMPAGSLVVAAAIMIMPAGIIPVLAGTSLIVATTGTLVVVSASAGILVPAVAVVLAIAYVLVVGVGGADHAEHGIHGFVELAFDKSGGVGGKAHLAHAHRGEHGALKAQGVAEHPAIRPAQKRGDAHGQVLLAKRPGKTRCVPHPGRKCLVTRSGSLKRPLQRGTRARKGTGEQRDEPGRKLLAQTLQVDLFAFAQARRQTSQCLFCLRHLDPLLFGESPLQAARCQMAPASPGPIQNGRPTVAACHLQDALMSQSLTRPRRSRSA